MSFIVPLKAVVEKAYELVISDYRLTDDDDADVMPKTPGNLRLELPDGEGTEVEFPPQNVTVDETGEFEAVDIEGKRHYCSGYMLKPIKENDLSPPTPANPMPPPSNSSKHVINNRAMTIGESGFCLTQTIQSTDSARYGGTRENSDNFKVRVDDRLSVDGSIFTGIYDLKNENQFLEIIADVSPWPEGPGVGPSVTLDSTGGSIKVFPSDEGFIIFNEGGLSSLVISGKKTS